MGGGEAAHEYGGVLWGCLCAVAAHIQAPLVYTLAQWSRRLALEFIPVETG